MKAKMVIHGNWIYNSDDGWHLAVYPVVTVVPRPDEPPLYTSFVLAHEENLAELGSPSCAIEKILEASTNPVSSMTLYNLEDIEDESFGETYNLLLVCPVADMSHTETHDSIVKEGYMYVEDLGITEEDDEVDRKILAALERLEAPHILTFTPKV